MHVLGFGLAFMRMTSHLKFALQSTGTAEYLNCRAVLTRQARGCCLTAAGLHVLFCCAVTALPDIQRKVLQ
jgi:hypothetical protein